MSDVADKDGLFGIGFIKGYRPLQGISDEMMEPSGALRPQWRAFFDVLNGLGKDELEARFEQVAGSLRHAGASFRVYDAPGTGERPWPVSRLPLLLEAQEWRTIAAGVIQRAQLQEALLQDVYGPQRLIAEGALPATVVAGSPEFLRPLVGVKPKGGRFLRLYAADVSRGPDGRWWVIADRAQAPSGAGYALENRFAMGAAFAEAFGSLAVERLAGFFQTVRTSLASLTSPGSVGVCMLTPGPMNETYSEQAFLARYLGYLLVEGEDLTTREDGVYVRTVAGLRRVDALVRRLDADFADPLELNVQSRIGTPGLVGAVRAGTVAMANALGSGFVESRALMGFLPQLANRILGQDLILPNIATWWCGQPAERQYVMDHLDELAIAPAFAPASSTAADLHLGANLKPRDKERLLDALSRRGMDFTGQEIVTLSTMPVWSEGRLTPRPFQMRVFAVATEDGGWAVMPGGFCRVSGATDPRAISMQQGGMSVDLWVTGAATAAPNPVPAAVNVAVKRHVGALTARTADNLFWFGRYLERAEATLRLIRAGHARAQLNDRNERIAAQTLSDMLAQRAAIDKESPLLTRRVALAALTNPRMIGSAAGTVAAAKRAAGRLRERLSSDVASATDELAEALATTNRTQTGPVERIDRAMRALSAIAGLIAENMAQVTGWRFLEIGRRIERALSTAHCVEALGLDTASPASLGALLELGDSSITYAQRYFAAPAQRPIIDLLVLDDHNPRSCAFQIHRIQDLVRLLPGEGVDEPLSKVLRLAERLSAETIAIDAAEVDAAFMASLREDLHNLSEALSERYLVNRERLAFSFRADE
jgi:uncharacterized circularly permuted ATP-grasp superfamily protein/uncharacterized alpha-E superfamily protein